MSLEKGICVGGAKVIDFHLKGCMVGQKCKNNISGRKSWKDEGSVRLRNPLIG
jgi:hypothetical protein